jgi:branched-chain amino acid aminotransferase
VRDNKLESCYLRPLVFYGSEAMGVAAKSNPVRVAISVWPWGAYLGTEALERASA